MNNHRKHRLLVHSHIKQYRHTEKTKNRQRNILNNVRPMPKQLRFECKIKQKWMKIIHICMIHRFPLWRCPQLCYCTSISFIILFIVFLIESILLYLILVCGVSISDHNSRINEWDNERNSGTYEAASLHFLSIRLSFQFNTNNS